MIGRTVRASSCPVSHPSSSWSVSSVTAQDYGRWKGGSPPSVGGANPPSPEVQAAPSSAIYQLWFPVLKYVERCVVRTPELNNQVKGICPVSSHTYVPDAIIYSFGARWPIIYFPARVLTRAQNHRFWTNGQKHGLSFCQCAGKAQGEQLFNVAESEVELVIENTKGKRCELLNDDQKLSMVILLSLFKWILYITQDCRRKTSAAPAAAPLNCRCVTALVGRCWHLT